MDVRETVNPYGVFDIVILWVPGFGNTGMVPQVVGHELRDRRTGIVHYKQASTNGTAQKHYREAQQLAINYMKTGTRQMLY